MRPLWAAEAFPDLDADVRQSIARITSDPFVPHKRVRGFVFDVATGKLREVVYARPTRGVGALNQAAVRRGRAAPAGPAPS